MEKGRSLLRWAGILLVCAISFVVIEAQGETEAVKEPVAGRPDLIKIDTLARFGKLELPPVTFFHDKHTEVLLKEGKNCEACHLSEGGKLSLAYGRTKATTSTEIKDRYHASCIGCHAERAAAGQKAGPLDGFCRSCHNPEPKVTLARLDAGLNKVLHFRHVDSKGIRSQTADPENCARCHHEYDPQAKKVFYARGKEGTCRYCHLDKPKDEVKSLAQASHQQCVLCHLNLANQGVKEHGPYDCTGCHGAQGQALVAKKNQEMVAKLPNREVPRLKRGQPDAVLVTYIPNLKDASASKSPKMNPVPFDHKAHEKYNNNCRVCHHASMESCAKCHTLAGVKEGKFVTFEQAMHLKSGKPSCIGCHAEKQAAPNCAGCHKSIVETGRPDTGCQQCHLALAETVLQGGGTGRDNLLKMTSSQKSALAESMLKSRNLNPGIYPLADIPEKVVIKELSDKYDPSEMTHRKQFLALVKGTEGSQLATYFHSDRGTLCQGCHHHSPPSKNPPGCGSCHAVPPRGQTSFDPREANRPGLLAAMHGQCMSCHTDMGLEKPAATACIECHREKKK